MMTRKHFELIAQTLNKAHKHDHNKNVVQGIAFDLSVKFQAMNPNFSQTKFIQAVTKD
jgi:hypothetical protein